MILRAHRLKASCNSAKLTGKENELRAWHASLLKRWPCQPEGSLRYLHLISALLSMADR